MAQVSVAGPRVRGRAPRHFSNATHGPPKQVLAPLGHTRTMLMKFASHREAMKCVVLSNVGVHAAVLTPSMVRMCPSHMPLIITSHGPIDHRVSASHSHVLILGSRVPLWVDVIVLRQHGCNQNSVKKMELKQIKTSRRHPILDASCNTLKTAL